MAFWDAFQRALEDFGMSRTPSIPKELVGEVIRLNEQGLGRRRIAQALGRHGCRTSKSSVERLIKGLPPYENRATVHHTVRPEHGLVHHAGGLQQRPLVGATESPQSVAGE